MSKKEYITMPMKRFIYMIQSIEKLTKENIKLKNKLLDYERPLQPQIMENQISIEEYTKSLKPKGNKNEKL
jgi:hypothetical protein